MSMINKFDVAVIGGGPAGLFAAGRLIERGKKTVIIEKNNRFGKKLLITGKGRCNLTNNADISEFFDNIVKNPDFMYSSLYTFTNTDLMDFFEKSGVELKVERGERVFPKSDKSMDILTALKDYVKKATFIFNKSAERIITEDNTIKGVELSDGEIIYADSVILATGGLSYPVTGSTGDGYKMAKEAGHRITKLKPALVPLILNGDIPKRLEGLSLKNVQVRLLDERGKKLYEDFGEMLFTAKGVSGPVILSMSSFVQDGRDAILSIDLKPALSEEKLDERIRRDFQKYSNKNYINSLSDLLPKKLIDIIAELSGIDKEKKVNQITAKERKSLLNVLKNFRFDIKCKGSINEAIITDGGIDVSEINPSTMESKIIKGLYFAGEIIDVHAYTGGFNLQIAFSTAYLAAENV